MFHGVTTPVDYLMRKSLYTYIKYMIRKIVLKTTFLNEPEIICLHTVKGFHVFLSNANNSVYY